METVDIIIPAYRPGKEFENLLDSLSTQNYPVEKNSCYEYRREILEHGLGEKNFQKVNVVHLKKGGF